MTVTVRNRGSGAEPTRLGEEFDADAGTSTLSSGDAAEEDVADLGVLHSAQTKLLNDLVDLQQARTVSQVNFESPSATIARTRLIF